MSPGLPAGASWREVASRCEPSAELCLGLSVWGRALVKRAGVRCPSRGGTVTPDLCPSIQCPSGGNGVPGACAVPSHEMVAICS